MKKVFALLFCVILSGCYPSYYSHTQEIVLTDFYEMFVDAKVYYNEEEQTDKVKLFRSWFDKELIVKRAGFKDYHVKLESSWTDDEWIRECGAWDIGCPIVGPLLLFTAPILPIWNPWKEYKSYEFDIRPVGYHQNEMFLSPYSIVMEPVKNIDELTKELKQDCNQKGFFISNLGCTECSYKKAVIATKSESNRCLDRFYNKNTKMSYSCDEKTNVMGTIGCEKCKNRILDKSYHSYCTLNYLKLANKEELCPDTAPLRVEKDSGIFCYSCDHENLRDRSKEDCLKCPGMFYKGGKCSYCRHGFVSSDGRCVHEYSQEYHDMIKSKKN